MLSFPNALVGRANVSGSVVLHTRVPAGDMDGGSDRRIPAGDMNSGGDVRKVRETI